MLFQKLDRVSCLYFFVSLSIVILASTRLLASGIAVLPSSTGTFAPPIQKQGLAEIKSQHRHPASGVIPAKPHCNLQGSDWVIIADPLDSPTESFFIKLPHPGDTDDTGIIHPLPPGVSEISTEGKPVRVLFLFPDQLRTTNDNGGNGDPHPSAFSSTEVIKPSGVDLLPTHIPLRKCQPELRKYGTKHSVFMAEAVQIPYFDHDALVFQGNDDEHYIYSDFDHHAYPSGALIAIKGRCPVFFSSDATGISQQNLCDGASGLFDSLAQSPNIPAIIFSENAAGVTTVTVRTSDGKVQTMTIENYRQRLSYWFEGLMEAYLGLLPMHAHGPRRNTYHRIVKLKIKVPPPKKDDHDITSGEMTDTPTKPPVEENKESQADGFPPPPSSSSGGGSFEGATGYFDQGVPQQPYSQSITKKRADTTSITIPWREIPMMNHKQAKELENEVANTVANTVVGMLNTNGGVVVIKYTNKTPEQVTTLTRAVEQRIGNFTEAINLSNSVEINQDKNSLLLTVRPTNSLVTVDSHLYMPTESQARRIRPDNSIHTLNALFNPERTREVSDVPFIELPAETKDTKYVQFKDLKKERTKCVTLADRITNKSNKIRNYLSAFANTKGGVICFTPVRDDPLDEQAIDKDEITRKVTKVVNSMFWTEGKIKKGIHWDIEFVDQDDNKETLIIVKIKPLRGAVFAEQPESYVIANHRVEKMTFQDWLRRTGASEHPVPSTSQAITAGHQKPAPYQLALAELHPCLTLVCQLSPDEHISHNNVDSATQIIIFVVKALQDIRMDRHKVADDLLNQCNEIILSSSTTPRVMRHWITYARSILNSGEGLPSQTNLDQVIQALRAMEGINEPILLALLHLQAGKLSALIAQNKELSIKEAQHLLENAALHFQDAEQSLDQESWNFLIANQLRQEIAINRDIMFLENSDLVEQVLGKTLFLQQSKKHHSVVDNMDISENHLNAYQRLLVQSLAQFDIWKRNKKASDYKRTLENLDRAILLVQHNRLSGVTRQLLTYRTRMIEEGLLYRVGKMPSIATRPKEKKSEPNKSKTTTLKMNGRSGSNKSL